MKRLLALLLVSVMTAALFTGCGSSEPATPKAEASKETVSKEVEEEPKKEAPVEVPEEEITLKFATWTDETKMFSAIIDKFEAAYPNITVEMIEYPAKEYGTTLTVNLAGDGGLDLYCIKSNENFSDVAFKGLTEPLDRFIEKDKLDVSAFGPLYDAAKINGEVQALPYRKSAWVLYYNKNLFDAAGVDYPSNDMTWDEFRATAKKMTQGEGEDKIWGTYVHSWVSCWVTPGVQTGATVADEDLSAFEKALELRVGLQEDGSTLPYEEMIATTSHYNAAFQKGNLAMHYMGEWHVGQLRNAEKEGAVDFDWDIVPMPHFEGVQPNTTIGNATNIGINSNASEEQKAAAWELLKYITSEEGQIEVAKAGTLPAAVTPAVTEAYLGESNEKPANLAIIMEQAVYPETPIIPDINYIVNTIYKEESALALIGEQTPGEAIEMIKERIQDEVN